MNQEALRQIGEWKAVRARMGAPLTPVTPVLAKPKPLPIKPIRLIQESASAPSVTLIVTGFWGYHALTAPTLRKSSVSILQEVSEETGFSIAEIKGPSRRAPIVMARQFAMWRIRKECPHLSLPQIGKIFSGRDHATVIHAIQKIERLRDKSPEAIAA